VAIGGSKDAATKNRGRATIDLARTVVGESCPCSSASEREGKVLPILLITTYFWVPEPMLFGVPRRASNALN
jgi:hypothetical protein